jgi:hypothetical protein
MIPAAVLGPTGIWLCLLATGWSKLWGVGLTAIAFGCVAAHSFLEDRIGKQLVENIRRQNRRCDSANEEPKE